MTDYSSLVKRRKIMIEYLMTRLDIEDWHGVQDAASDIREIDAQLKILGERSDK